MKQRSRSQEGMTLVEIMIVVVIMALIAGAVGVAVFPQWEKAQRKTAETDVSSIGTAVQLYRTDSPRDCPAVGDLDLTNEPVDPWGTEYQVECEGSAITVSSAGPDTQPGTEDDIIHEVY